MMLSVPMGSGRGKAAWIVRPRGCTFVDEMLEGCRILIHCRLGSEALLLVVSGAVILNVFIQRGSLRLLREGG